MIVRQYTKVMNKIIKLNTSVSIKKLIATAGLLSVGILLSACQYTQLNKSSQGIAAYTEDKFQTEISLASPAKKLVLESIAAHGGMTKWHNNGLLAFRWTYHLEDKEPKVVVDTVQTVDPVSHSVVHEVLYSNIRFGIDNNKHWISPINAKFSPPHKFWALTPYYFIGMPFVYNDSNANYEQLEETIAFEDQDYLQVKITYKSGTGDSPDDYYVLLIHPKTKLTRGAYYTVTNKLVAANGVGSAKFITLDNLQNINGVLLAGGHRTFRMVDGKITEQMRYTEVNNVKFLPRGSVSFSEPE